jgi:hypothetical protein
MIDWWWDNIKDTARYHRWHPTAHQTFTWTMAPKNSADLKYDVGAVQQIVEVIGNPTTLDITWLDPANVPIPLTYDHFVYGSTMLDGTPFGGFLLHEYAAQPEGWYAIRSSAGSPLRAGNAVPAVLRTQLVRGGIPSVARTWLPRHYEPNLRTITCGPGGFTRRVELNSNQVLPASGDSTAISSDPLRAANTSLPPTQANAGAPHKPPQLSQHGAGATGSAVGMPCRSKLLSCTCGCSDRAE